MAWTGQKLSRFHIKIRNVANALMQQYVDRGLLPKPSGACVDCGATKYLRYDHRDYSQALTPEVVCQSCNCKRGQAWIPFLNVETLEWVRYRERIRHIRRAA